MSVFVKICGLTHADDVAAAVDAGADALGFVFADSKRRVAPEQAASISRGIPGHVLRVAVMLHPSGQEWREVLDGFAPDVLQTDAEDFAALAIPGAVRRWPVYRQGGAHLGEPAPAEYVYEGARSGHGETVDWRRAAAVARTNRMILAGGLGPGNVAAAIAAVRPWGVDASSSLEREPGRKDADKMAAYVAAAKAAEFDSQA
jgi:phosphoribosylanthranilate isomerase